MKRDIIIIEDNTISVNGNEIWMTATEIAGLFHTGVPAVNAAIRAVRKPDVLNDFEVCRYMRLENGLHADVYSLEIIIPVAFRLNTYHAHVFRTWLVEKALSKERRQATWTAPYNHSRPNETAENLVCGLRLDKKKQSESLR